MKRYGALTALALVLSVGAAGATDLKGTTSNDSSMFPIPTVSRDSLTGFYAGISGGADFANTAISGEDTLSMYEKEIPFGVNLDGIGSTGFIGEGQIGYDYQVGKVVFGAFGGGNISSTKTTFDAYVGDLEVARAELTRDWGWYAGARVGYAASKDTLVYVAGGYTQADFSLNVDGDKATETFNGYFGEAGIESRISGPVFAKAFGRYVAYDTKDYGGVTVDPEELQAMVGLVIKR